MLSIMTANGSSSMLKGAAATAADGLGESEGKATGEGTLKLGLGEGSAAAGFELGEAAGAAGGGVGGALAGWQAAASMSGARASSNPNRRRQYEPEGVTSGVVRSSRHLTPNRRDVILDSSQSRERHARSSWCSEDVRWLATGLTRLLQVPVSEAAEAGLQACELGACGRAAFRKRRARSTTN